jgi:hypothetical protein
MKKSMVKWQLGVALGAALLMGCATSAAPSQAPAAKPVASASAFDRQQVLDTVRVLAADDMRGRSVQDVEKMTEVRAFLKGRMAAVGLKPAGENGYETPFTQVRPRRDGTRLEVNGINLIGLIPGKGSGENPVIVITAHYDHVGKIKGEIYNGADDNASGVAAALAIAESYQGAHPRHDIYVALLDAEEIGLLGAKAFVESPPVPLSRIALNINFDMVSKNDKNELYASGTYHNPQLVPIIEKVAAKAPVKLLMGHDRPEQGPDDWTLLSDHGRFHQAGVPFIYFGVEDHPEYHKPTDDFETIPQAFFLDAVTTLVMATHAFDQHLSTD